MKLTIILAVLLIFVAGCSIVQDERSTHKILGTKDLILNERDLQQLGMINNLNKTDLEQLGITENNCRTDYEYSNIIDSSLGQYSICSYIISSLNDTKVIIELQKFANYEALNGTYQYNSMHLFGTKGLISENDFGDQSRFRVNSEDDYGAEFNEPGMYYYHLWICKDLYLIHITSSGRSKEAKDYIARIGRQILSKFE